MHPLFSAHCPRQGGRVHSKTLWEIPGIAVKSLPRVAGGVQCYAGYLVDGNKKYAFAVMINKFNGTRPQVRGAIEQFLQGL